MCVKFNFDVDAYYLEELEPVMDNKPYCSRFSRVSLQGKEYGMNDSKA